MQEQLFSGGTEASWPNIFFRRQRRKTRPAAGEGESVLVSWAARKELIILVGICDHTLRLLTNTTDKHKKKMAARKSDALAREY